MITESVRADDGGAEGKWVALAILVILSVAFVALPFHQAEVKTQALARHQVLITDLSPNELAMIADLRLAHEEIRNLHQDSMAFEPEKMPAQHWPKVDELEAMWLAPFVKDKSWEHKGRHDWQRVISSVYLGTPEEANGSKAVVLLADAEQPDIWFALFNTAKTIPTNTILTPSQLIDAGWMQVVFEAAANKHSH
ncbi:DUF6162 family protein [Photobacterium nomapromontoriensis]|uniref:DUF6162 family protein n=1 Tax=Photobacterium nomapromontoriensis TaxID=2910237 RepID=UPI003D0CB16B